MTAGSTVFDLIVGAADAGDGKDAREPTARIDTAAARTTAAPERRRLSMGTSSLAGRRF
jgi:hypothetical protein